MASPQDKLNYGIDKVFALSAARIPDESLADEAFATLKVGIVQCRKDCRSIDRQSHDRVLQVLYFLVRRSIKKKVSRSQVFECLKILLVRSSWLSAVHQDMELLSLLKQAFADNTELTCLLDATPSAQYDDRIVHSYNRSSKPSGIQEQLNYGLRIMKSFGWEFPCDPLGNKIDEATDGFKRVFDAVTHITNSGRKAPVGGDIDSVLAAFEYHWHGLFRFLTSMYTCGFRASHKGRIRFVVVNLRRLSEKIRSQAPWAKLPWGSDPMPPDETSAAEAVRVAEEEEETVNDFLMQLEQDEPEPELSIIDMPIKTEEQKSDGERVRKHFNVEHCRAAQSLRGNELTRICNVIIGC